MWERNDAVISGTKRGLRGGSWDDGPGGATRGLASSERGYFGLRDPTYADVVLGFRVASVPEPTTGILAMFAGGVLLIRRKR